MVCGFWRLATPLTSGFWRPPPPRPEARPTRGACHTASFPAGTQRDSSCACALCRCAPPRPPLARPRALCAHARSYSSPRGARLSQSVCRSQSSGQPAPGTSESQLLDRPVSPPTLPPHVSLHHSPALALTAMAESSAATQSPSISSSSSGAEPSALGSGGSPGACPAQGAKSCGSSCAGEARGELDPWGARATGSPGGGGRPTRAAGGFGPEAGV